MLVDLTQTCLNKVPLCVDLDGTIIVGDSLRRAFLEQLLKQPFSLSQPLATLLTSGRAAFKESMGELYSLEPHSMPWRNNVLAYLHGQALNGRRLILTTAAPNRFANVVANYLGLFESVISSDARNNIKGMRKVNAIRSHLGNGPFDYAGDSWTDLPVFAASRQVIIVSRDILLIQKAHTLTRIEKIFYE